MGAILRPFTNLLNPVCQKPMGRVAIDWSHQFAQQLKHCVIFNEAGVPIDFVTGGYGTRTLGSGSQQWTMTQDGVGYFLGGAASGSYLTFPATLPVENLAFGDITISLIFTPITIGSGYDILIQKNVGATREFNIHIGNNNAVRYIGFNGTYGPDPFTGAVLSANVRAHVLVTRSGLATNCVSCYVNAVRVGQGTITGTSAGTPSNVFWLGNDGFGGTSPNVRYISVQVWKRAFSQEEVVSLYNNPYQLLIPAEYELPIMPGPPAIFQRHYRFRTDTDFVDNTPTWGTAEDA